MEFSNIKVVLEEGVNLPIYESNNAVGFDLKVNKILATFKGDMASSDDKVAKINEGFVKRKYVKLRAFERILFGTGIYVEMPSNMELQIRSRSGVALKRGLMVANSPGTIDPDYRGEIGIIIYNSSPFLTQVDFNERLAQAVPCKVVRPALIEQTELSSTERGEGGFGSTGTIDDIEVVTQCTVFQSSNTGLTCDNCGKHKSEHLF